MTSDEYAEKELLIHDEMCDDPTLAYILGRMSEEPSLPLPVGVFRCVQRPCYEDGMESQINASKKRFGEGNLETLLNSGDTWEVK